jgi:ATP-dependent DNA helicase RecQ
MTHPVIYDPGWWRYNLFLEVIQVGGWQCKLDLLRGLLQGLNTSGILYCSTRVGVERLTRDLNREGFDALGYHAGMSKSTRDKAQHFFMNGEVRLMVATNALGMGVDLPECGFVLHWNSPSSLEDYCQQIGRAGRKGGFSRCILFYCNGEIGLRKRLLGDQRFSEEGDSGRLQAMSMYAKTYKCRHLFLRRYIGGSNMENPCGGMCDNCNPHMRVSRNYEVPMDTKLFNRLQSLRKKISEREGLPEFCILTDRMLRNLCKERPLTKQHFILAIGGCSEKYFRYGEKFISLLARHRN